MNEDRDAVAADAFEWVQAYIRAGFTEEQAIRMLVASHGRAIIPAASPEMSEYMARISRFLEREMFEE